MQRQLPGNISPSGGVELVGGLLRRDRELKKTPQRYRSGLSAQCCIPAPGTVPGTL